MKKKYILLIDAVINFILGVLLLLYSRSLAVFLGIPPADSGFYPSMLGGVFIGITVALVTEAYRKTPDRFIGLGLIGALCINICGGAVLTGWLIFGGLTMPLKGYIILWTIAFLLVVISTLELIMEVKRKT